MAPARWVQPAPSAAGCAPGGRAPRGSSGALSRVTPIPALFAAQERISLLLASPEPAEISQHAPYNDLCLAAALKRNKNTLLGWQSLVLLTSACAPTQSHFTSPLPCPPHSGIQRGGRASSATGAQQESEAKPALPVPGKESAIFFLPTTCLPVLPHPRPAPPRASPMPPASWPRQGIHPAKGCPAPRTNSRCGLASRDGAWHLPQHL